MPTSVIHQVIGRALTERSFRERLLVSPAAAMHGYPLSAAERSQIASVEAADLEQFSRLLSERLRETPDQGRNGSAD